VVLKKTQVSFETCQKLFTIVAFYVGGKPLVFSFQVSHVTVFQPIK